MSKSARDRFHLQSNMPKKFHHKMSQGFKGDQLNIKSKEPSFPKTPVYVHQFKSGSKEPALSYTYSNGFPGYFEEKSNYLKAKFDALTLKNNQGQDYVPAQCGEKNAKYNKCPVHQSKINMRIRGFEVVDKYMIQKLEENYWSNWKPNYGKASMNPPHEEKPVLKILKEKLHTNEKPSITAVIKEGNINDAKDANKPVHYIHKPLEPYESKSSEIVLNIIAPETTNKSNEDFDEVETPKVAENTSVHQSNSENEKEITSFTKNLNLLEVKLSKTLTPHLTISNDSSASDQLVLNPIKHTDSLILTSRKQQQEKPHYQQPKCIKLQRKEPPVLVKSSRNYIKGGTYPLKSCLKKEKSSHRKYSLHLGKPGSSIILCGAKQSSTKKLRKK